LIEEVKMKAPIFVKIGRYKEVEDMVSQIKAKVEEARGILNKLGQFKAEEENELHAWQEDLRQIEEKIGTLEQSITR